MKINVELDLGTALVISDITTVPCESTADGFVTFKPESWQEQDLKDYLDRAGYAYEEEQ